MCTSFWMHFQNQRGFSVSLGRNNLNSPYSDENAWWKEFAVSSSSNTAWRRFDQEFEGIGSEGKSQGKRALDINHRNNESTGRCFKIPFIWFPSILQDELLAHKMYINFIFYDSPNIPNYPMTFSSFLSSLTCLHPALSCLYFSLASETAK